MTVKAGVEEQAAVDEADLLRIANSDITPSDRDLVNSDAEAVRDIFEDEPDACKAADWVEEPSAPSEGTFWDDSRHFENRYVDTGTDGGQPDD